MLSDGMIDGWMGSLRSFVSRWEGWIGFEKVGGMVVRTCSWRVFSLWYGLVFFHFFSVDVDYSDKGFFIHSLL